LLRPELALQLGGVYVADADGEALRTAVVDAIVEARIAELGDDTMYAENRQTVIEALFTESGMAADPVADLAQLRATHTTPDTDETPGGFDALAYTEALRDRLIENHPLEDGVLTRLATDRVNAAKQAIAGDNVALAARIVVDEATAQVELDDELVPMQVRLTSGKELGIQVPQDTGSGQATTFQCGDNGPTIGVTFVGPETLRLESGDTARILQLQRSASGARYGAEGVEFWNKGDSAMFTDGDNRYDCLRLVP
jgi:membrane-bound inhibitor of C-type lysozyme